MAHYLQRERYLDDVIPVGGIVGFDLEVTVSMTEDLEADPPIPAEADFRYHTEGAFVGAIDVLRRGDYLIMWGLDQLSDRPLTTDFFQLRQWIDSPISSRWETMGGTSTHLKAAATVGFAILNKTSDDPTTVAIFNDSGEDIHLNSFGDGKVLRQKARIVFFGLSEADGDFTGILELIELDACCYDLDELADRIRKITLREVDQYNRIEELQVKHMELSNEYQFLSKPPVLARWAFKNISSKLPLLGMFLCCKRVGYVHYLWIEGSSSARFDINPSDSNGYQVLPAKDMWMYDENGQLYRPFLERFPYTEAVYGLCWVYDGGIPSEHQFRLEPPTSPDDNDTKGGLWIRAASNVQGYYLRMNAAISLAPTSK